MPNHCYQQVHLRGAKDLIVRLHDELKSNGRFCDHVIPMPIETWIKPDVDVTVTTQKGKVDCSNPDWYEWRCDNWGTKWDVVNVEITDCSWGKKNEFEMVFSKEPIESFAFNCWTAWSPPLPVWNRLHELGVEIDASYQDEGGMFEGEYVNGVDNSWSPEDEEENYGS